MSPPALNRARPLFAQGWTRTTAAVLLTVLAVAACWGLRLRLSEGDVALVLLLAVMGAGAGFGLFAALLSAGVSALGYDFLFLAPRFTFGIERPADTLTFAMFFVTALATGWLGGRARDGERRASEREGETLRLLATTRRLASEGSVEQTALALAQQARAASGLDAAVLLGEADALTIAAADPPVADLEPLSLLAARWTHQRREASGAGTEVNREAEWALHALLGSATAEGVLALRGQAGATERLVQGVAVSGGLALERARLATVGVENEALRRTDRLRSALLNSLSHDLRTPLAGILGSATTLIDYGATLPEAVRTDLLSGVREETERLDRYIGDLLDISRLEAGALAPRLELCDLRDVATGALARVAPAVTASLPKAPALAQIDPVLLEQALVNVLDNAMVHGANGAADGVRLALREDASGWRIEVEDSGPGLSPQTCETVFTPFARGDTAARGSGLGLSIARGFAEAMGGGLQVVSPASDNRGARFVFHLPRAPA